MAPLTAFEVAGYRAIEASSYALGTYIFFKICREVSSIAGAPSLRDWTSKRPYYPTVIFKAHRINFPASHLTSLYWILAFALIGSVAMLELHHAGVSVWLNVFLGLVGISTWGRLFLQNELAAR